MFESLLWSLVEKLGHKYVAGFRPEELSIRWWQGEIELFQVELRPEALNALLPRHSPYAVKSGRASSLRCKIPWHALFSESIEVVLSGVHLNLCLTSEIDPTRRHQPSTHKDRNSSQKIEKSSFHHQEEKKKERNTTDTTSTTHTRIKQLKRQILDNLVLIWQDVHVSLCCEKTLVGIGIQFDGIEVSPLVSPPRECNQNPCQERNGHKRPCRSRPHLGCCLASEQKERCRAKRIQVTGLRVFMVQDIRDACQLWQRVQSWEDRVSKKRNEEDDVPVRNEEGDGLLLSWDTLQIALLHELSDHSSPHLALLTVGASPLRIRISDIQLSAVIRLVDALQECKSKLQSETTCEIEKETRFEDAKNWDVSGTNEEVAVDDKPKEETLEEDQLKFWSFVSEVKEKENNNRLFSANDEMVEFTDAEEMDDQERDILVDSVENEDEGASPRREMVQDMENESDLSAEELRHFILLVAEHKEAAACVVASVKTENGKGRESLKGPAVFRCWVEMGGIDFRICRHSYFGCKMPQESEMGMLTSPSRAALLSGLEEKDALAAVVRRDLILFSLGPLRLDLRKKNKNIEKVGLTVSRILARDCMADVCLLRMSSCLHHSVEETVQNANIHLENGFPSSSFFGDNHDGEKEWISRYECHHGACTLPSIPATPCVGENCIHDKCWLWDPCVDINVDVISTLDRDGDPLEFPLVKANILVAPIEIDLRLELMAQIVHMVGRWKDQVRILKGNQSKRKKHSVSVDEGFVANEEGREKGRHKKHEVDESLLHEKNAQQRYAWLRALGVKVELYALLGGISFRLGRDLPLSLDFCVSSSYITSVVLDQELVSACDSSRSPCQSLRIQSSGSSCSLWDTSEEKRYILLEPTAIVVDVAWDMEHGVRVHGLVDAFRFHVPLRTLVLFEKVQSKVRHLFLWDELDVVHWMENSCVNVNEAREAFDPEVRYACIELNRNERDCHFSHSNTLSSRSQNENHKRRKGEFIRMDKKTHFIPIQFSCCISSVHVDIQSAIIEESSLFLFSLHKVIFI